MAKTPEKLELKTDAANHPFLTEFRQRASSLGGGTVDHSSTSDKSATNETPPGDDNDGSMTRMVDLLESINNNLEAMRRGQTEFAQQLERRLTEIENTFSAINGGGGWQ